MPAEQGGGFFAAAQEYIPTAIRNSFGLGSRSQESAEARNKTRQSNGNREQAPGKTTREATPLETRDAPPPRTKANPTQRSVASEEELRYFGDFRQPSDAVTIKVPTSLPPAMPSKVPTGNFRPLDTLHQGPSRNVSQFFSRTGSSSQDQSRTVASGLTNKPRLSSTKGLFASNDDECAKRKHIDLTEANESSRKRQRVDSAPEKPSPQSLSDVSVSSGNRTNSINGRQVRRMEPSEYRTWPPVAVQPRSPMTVHSGHRRDRPRQNEYHAVESLMNPRTRRAPSQSARVRDDSIDDLSKEVSPHFQVIDNDSKRIFRSTDHDGGTSDAGTQAPHTEADAQRALHIRRIQRREHESRECTDLTRGGLSRSPQVPGRNGQRPLKPSVSTSNSRVATRQAEQIRHHTSQGRAVLPVQPDRRQATYPHTSPESLDNSIDELADETTLDHRASHRHVTCGMSSDEKLRLRLQQNSEEQSPPIDNQSCNDDDGSSNDIHATDFYISKKPRHAGNVEPGKEEKSRPLWRRYNVREFRIGNCARKRAGDTLHYRPMARSFVLENQQHKLIRAGDEGLPLSINPTSVLWGMYSEESPYWLHLISGPSSTDCQWVDIEFSGYEDLIGFLDEFDQITLERVEFKIKSSGDRAQWRSLLTQPLKNAPEQEATELSSAQNRAGKRENSSALNNVQPPPKRSRQSTLVSQLQPERAGGMGMVTGKSPYFDDEILYDIPPDNDTTRPKVERRSNGPMKTYGATPASKQKSLAPEYDFEVPDDQKFSKVNGLGTAWKKPLVFPVDGPKKMQVTVDFDDLYRLDEGEFLNDSLIQFYLRFCEVNSPKKSNASVLLFNTYFYTSLTPPAKGKRGINYDRVKRWTAKLAQSDIFNYDFVVVPVNESAHWYLAIICNLTNINRTYHADDSEGLPSPTTDIHFDVSREAHDDPLVDDEDQPGKVNDEEDAVRERYSQMSLEEEDRELHSRQKEIGPSFRSDSRTVAGELSKATSETRQAVPDSYGELEIDAPRTPKQPEASRQGDDIGKVAGTATKRAKRKSGGGGLRKYDPDQPMIITLDSLGGSHPGTVKNLKDYLVAEAREKRSMDIPDGKIQGITAKGIPEQANYCDCGLFLLGYAAKFMENPRDFVRRIAQREFNSETDWPELNPSDMRNNIRSLLQTLYAEQSGEPKALKNDAKVEKEKPSAKVVVSGSAPTKPLQVLANGSGLASPKDESQTELHVSKRGHQTEQALLKDSTAYAFREPTVTAASQTPVGRSSTRVHITDEVLDDSLEVADLRRARRKEQIHETHDTEQNTEDEEMLDKGLQGMANPASSSGKEKRTGKQKLFDQRLLIPSNLPPTPHNPPSSPSSRSQPVVIVESPPPKTVQPKAQTPKVDATNDEPVELNTPKERRNVNPEPLASVAAPFGKGHSYPPFQIHIDDSGPHDVSISRTRNSPLRIVRGATSSPTRPTTRGKQ